MAVAGHRNRVHLRLLEAGQQLVIVAESDLVIFGDGIEADSLSLTWVKG